MITPITTHFVAEMIYCSTIHRILNHVRTVSAVTQNTCRWEMMYAENAEFSRTKLYSPHHLSYFAFLIFQMG